MAAWQTNAADNAVPSRFGDNSLPSNTKRQQPSTGGSGRYEYKDWVEVAPGQFEARKANASVCHTPALINSAYRNPNGESTVYGIVFDLDARDPSNPTKLCASPTWEDSEGRLDWPRMEKALRAECPELAAAITHVVRSSGGKGLAVVVGINPLPLRESTSKNQSAARSLQGRIAGVFARLGFGPDPDARGLVRDFPNWRDPLRALVVRTSLIRSIEGAREPIVTQLHRVLNKLDKAREPFRLYADARVEPGLARLALWLLGEYAPTRPKAFLASHGAGESDGAQKALPTLMHFGEDQGFATVRELGDLTGLGEAFLRRLLAEPPSWLKVDPVSRSEGWRLWLPITGQVGDIVLRARELHTKGKATTVGSAWRPAELPRPELVEDGMRNGWIVKLALSYKWAGFSHETALRKIRLRLRFIPGAQSSRNCRQVARIVRSLFLRMPEHEGRFPHRELPAWITDDLQFEEKEGAPKDCSFFSHSNTGRGIAPVAPEPGVSVDALLPPPTESPRGLDQGLELGFTLAGNVPSPVRVWMVRWKQRIGLVDAGEVFAVFTRSHFRAAAIESHLASLPRFAGKTPYLRAPRMRAQAPFREAIESGTVTPSWLVCGRRERLGEALARWSETDPSPSSLPSGHGHHESLLEFEVEGIPFRGFSDPECESH